MYLFAQISFINSPSLSVIVIKSIKQQQKCDNEFVLTLICSTKMSGSAASSNAGAPGPAQAGGGVTTLGGLGGSLEDKVTYIFDKFCLYLWDAVMALD